MHLALVFIIALLLDALFGDPRWLPHPVRGMGILAQRVEPLMRRAVRDPRLAGVAAATTVVLVSAEAALILAGLACLWHPGAGVAVAALLVYTAIAPHDLLRHSQGVAEPLASGDLAGARAAVSRMVGRDTGDLDAAGVTRAVVESVAENLVDGVTSARFWALAGGLAGGVVGAAVGAVAYRAINTLDATYGYRNERYIRFGWMAARTDDVANFIPARLTVPFIVLAAGLLGERAHLAWRTAWRDGRRHSSPNSGLSEAAMAGALGVQLGGPVTYRGVPCDHPTIGDAVEVLGPRHIQRANRVLLVATCLFATLCAAVAWLARDACG